VAKLVVTRGLPGCGKTTWALAWVAEDRSGRARVNRDELRAMIDGGAWAVGITEEKVVRARDAVIGDLLRDGIDVVCDDTNLAARTVRELVTVAGRNGAEVEVEDMTGVPLEVCLARDAAREHPVGEAAIRDLYRRYLEGRKRPFRLPAPLSAAAGRPYLPPAGAPSAVLVDVDGTVALIGDRSPYDETLVHLDTPNPPVIEVVRALHTAGHAIVYCSGRTERSRPATAAWLTRHVGVPYAALLLRPTGDQRRDAIVKLELFDTHVRDNYAVLCVLDDRKQVVATWRSIGLTVLAVAEGDF
jgi:predicted kinase